MRKSLSELIERMFDVKTHLSISKYELYDFNDGAFADIKVQRITDPRTLCSIIGHLEFKILHDEENIIIRVFEDFNEYA